MNRLCRGGGGRKRTGERGGGENKEAEGETRGRFEDASERIGGENSGVK